MNSIFKLLILVFTLLFCVPGSCLHAEELNWDDCLAEAKKNNPELISSEEGISQQKSGRAIAASGLFPQISASAGAGKSGTERIQNGSTVNSTTPSFSYGFSGSQLLFDGFKTFDKVKAADENIKAAGHNYRFVSAQVRYDLRSAFINLLRAQEVIRVAEEIVKIRRDSLELIILRYESGLEHKGALLTAEANLSAAEFKLSQSKRAAELASRQLTKEMGRQKYQPITAKGEFRITGTYAQKPELEKIAVQSPAVLESRAKTNSAAFEMKSVYGDYLPKLSGNASAQKSGIQWPPRDKQWDGSFSLTFPLFEGGLRNAQLSEAKSLYRQAQANERSAEGGVLVSLEQYWDALQDAIENLQVQDKTLQAVQERAKIAEAQYSSGFINFDSWIIIQNDLVNTKLSFVESQTTSLLAEAAWLQAKGETLEYAP